MKTITLIALLVAMTAIAQATPTVTLGITASGSTWKLYAVASGDCAGLDSFAINFGGGAAYGQLTSASVQVPHFADTVLGSGMNLGFGGLVNSAASGVAEVFAQQAAAYDSNPVNSMPKDFAVLQGVGQTAGTKYGWDGNYLGGWTAPVLLAQGSFTGPAHFQPVSAMGNVLSGVAGSWHGPNNLQGATFVFQAGGSFPFPSGAGPSLFGPPLVADANADSKVSFADYLIVERNFGRTGMGLSDGDFNGDGNVTFADYLLLEQNFGKSSVSVQCPPDQVFTLPVPVFDSQTDMVNLLIFERNWGKTGMTAGQGDLSGNGKVDFSDYLIYESSRGGQPLPEPSAIGLVLLGGLGLLRRRR